MASTRSPLLRQAITALAGFALLFGAVSCGDSGAADENAEKKGAEKKENSSAKGKSTDPKQPKTPPKENGQPIAKGTGDLEKTKAPPKETTTKQNPKPVGDPVKVPGAKPKEVVIKEPKTNPKEGEGKPKKKWGTDHMELAEGLIGLLDQSATVLESAVDPLSAKAAADKFDKLTDQVVGLMKHMQDVGPPKGQTKGAIIKKVGAFQRKLDVRLQTSLARIGKNREMGQHIGPVWVRMAQESEAYKDVATSWGLR